MITGVDQSLSDGPYRRRQRCREQQQTKALLEGTVHVVKMWEATYIHVHTVPYSMCRSVHVTAQWGGSGHWSGNWMFWMRLSAEGSGCQLSISTTFPQLPSTLSFVRWDRWPLKMLHRECKVGLRSMRMELWLLTYSMCTQGSRQSFRTALQFYFRNKQAVAVWGSSVRSALSVLTSFPCQTAFISSRCYPVSFCLCLQKRKKRNAE